MTSRTTTASAWFAARSATAASSPTPGAEIRYTLDGAEPTRRSATYLARVVGSVIPFFIGLQLTGINFDLERTPGFAGSTLRSLAAKVEASSPATVVVVGAGHGRGDPASVIYELAPDATVCVIDNDSDVAGLSSELAAFDEIWFVFAKGRMTAATEQSLFETLTETPDYRVLSKAKRVAHLKKTSKNRGHR